MFVAKVLLKINGLIPGLESLMPGSAAEATAPTRKQNEERINGLIIKACLR
jgi:hypothetical protein